MRCLRWDDPAAHRLDLGDIFSIPTALPDLVKKMPDLRSLNDLDDRLNISIALSSWRIHGRLFA